MVCYLIGGVVGLASVYVSQANLPAALLLGGAVFLAGVIGLWALDSGMGCGRDSCYRIHSAWKI